MTNLGTEALARKIGKNSCHRLSQLLRVNTNKFIANLKVYLLSCLLSLTLLRKCKLHLVCEEWSKYGQKMAPQNGMGHFSVNAICFSLLKLIGHRSFVGAKFLVNSLVEQSREKLQNDFLLWTLRYQTTPPKIHKSVRLQSSELPHFFMTDSDMQCSTFIKEFYFWGRSSQIYNL